MRLEKQEQAFQSVDLGLDVSVVFQAVNQEIS